MHSLNVAVQTLEHLSINKEKNNLGYFFFFFLFKEACSSLSVASVYLHVLIVFTTKQKKKMSLAINVKRQIKIEYNLDEKFR